MYTKFITLLIILLMSCFYLNEANAQEKPNVLLIISDDAGYSETKNIAGEHPELVKEMQQSLEKWETGLTQPRWYDGGNWEHWAKVQIKNHKMD